MQTRMDLAPALCAYDDDWSSTFGIIQAWRGHTHFLTRRLPNVRTEISLHTLACNLQRVMAALGTKPLFGAIRA